MADDNTIVGKHWRGIVNVDYFIVFGDSYSSVRDQFDLLPSPTKNKRLGIEFPGNTWNEPDEPNWIGHLLSKPGMNPDMLVYDYALGGQTVDDMRTQVSDFRRQFSSTAPWNGTNSLFVAHSHPENADFEFILPVTWIGINDCGMPSDSESTQKTLFELQESLYAEGARNFLFIDVPPIDRSPAFAPPATVYETWNAGLRTSISTFASGHPDATILLFSSHDLFTRLLDNPVEYGFDQATASVAGGCIWYDHLHPTTRVHNVIASEVARFLTSQSSPVKQTLDDTN
ncbi:hypothetical protein BDW22DRAFT_1343459 [Trametopsis cervina]|nr:hypothetical protein BDW22DRAFT_1343459 [Trametopsis cervina]